MAITAPLFFDDVRFLIQEVLLVFALVIEGAAFVHCLTQRSDAFPAIGTLPKAAWLAIIGICMILTLVSTSGAVGLFGLIGIAAALIYLLDVRTGLRDLTDGKGLW